MSSEESKLAILKLRSSQLADLNIYSTHRVRFHVKIINAVAYTENVLQHKPECRALYRLKYCFKGSLKRKYQWKHGVK